MKKSLAILIAIVTIACGALTGCTVFDFYNRPNSTTATSDNENFFYPTVSTEFTPTPTTEVVLTVTNTPTVEPTAEPTEIVDVTPTEEPTLTAEPTEEVTPTVTVEVTPTEEPTPTIEVTPTVEPTKTPTVAPTKTPTAEPTKAPTPTKEVKPTATPTNKPTETPKPTATPTEKPKPTETPKPTATPTNTPKPTATPTATPTVEPTKPVEVKPYTMYVKVDTMLMTTDFGYICDLAKGTKVTVTKPDVLNRGNNNPIDEVTLANGKVGWVIRSELSADFVQGAYAEPIERKDIAELLMAKVNEYRASKGIRKFENPYTYYDVNNPGLGNRLTSNGLRVAKASCLAHTANHEGGQIGAGYYGGHYSTPANAAEMANELFTSWYNSPGHNANMLTNSSAYDGVDVAVMTVVEYYDGSHYQYCAIMSNSSVWVGDLPEGLK